MLHSWQTSTTINCYKHLLTKPFHHSVVGNVWLQAFCGWLYLLGSKPFGLLFKFRDPLVVSTSSSIYKCLGSQKLVCVTFLCCCLKKRGWFLLWVVLSYCKELKEMKEWLMWAKVSESEGNVFYGFGWSGISLWWEGTAPIFQLQSEKVMLWWTERKEVKSLLMLNKLNLIVLFIWAWMTGGCVVWMMVNLAHVFDSCSSSPLSALPFSLEWYMCLF